MVGRFIAKFALFLLKSKRLSGESKALVMSALLDNIKALPIRKVITFSPDGTIYIRGRRVEKADALTLLESAEMLQRNTFRRTLQEHIDFIAIELGVHNGLNQDMIMFSKAALWIHEQEKDILSKIVVDKQEDEDLA